MMAPKRIQAVVSSLLECTVCGGELRDPRTLSCGHAFCLTCIDQLAGQSASKVQLTCVCCHKRLWLPGGGSQQLPKNLLAGNAIKLLAGNFADDKDTSLTARRFAMEQCLVDAEQQEKSSAPSRAVSEYSSASTEIGCLVECDLCAQQYEDPRLLDCGHTFCLRCINSQVSETTRKMQVSCALCTRITWLTSSGLKDIAKNLVADTIRHILTTLDVDDTDKGHDSQLVEQCSVEASRDEPDLQLVAREHTASIPAEVIDTTPEVGCFIPSVKSVSSIEVRCSCCNTVLKMRAHYRRCGHRCCLRCSQGLGQGSASALSCKECARLKPVTNIRQAKSTVEKTVEQQTTIASTEHVVAVPGEVMVERSKEPPTMHTVQSVTSVNVTCSCCGADISRSAAATAQGRLRACGHRCCVRCQGSASSCKACARGRKQPLPAAAASVEH